jgi:hypothetical protein
MANNILYYKNFNYIHQVQIKHFHAFYVFEKFVSFQGHSNIEMKLLNLH